MRIHPIISAVAGILLVTLLAAGCATKTVSAPDLDDAAFVLPGWFSEQTTVADLQAHFGSENVRIIEADGRGGERSVVLFGDDPARRAHLDFHDDANLSGLRSISIRDVGSRWRGKDGVHVGMSFAELAVRNGKPFLYSGFDGQGRAWAHDGWSPALDDDDGGLGRFDVSEGDHMYFDVELGLRAVAKDLGAGAYPRDEYLRSDDLRYPRLGEIAEVTTFGASTSLDDEW